MTRNHRTRLTLLTSSVNTPILYHYGRSLFYSFIYSFDYLPTIRYSVMCIFNIHAVLCNIYIDPYLKYTDKNVIRCIKSCIQVHCKHFKTVIIFYLEFGSISLYYQSTIRLLEQRFTGFVIIYSLTYKKTQKNCDVQMIV